MKEKLNAFVAEFKQEALLDAIRIKLSSTPALEITQSKVGGLFYLPKSATIPINSKGEQLMFLAQINCEELPENSIYPAKGIMQFWIFGGDYDMGNNYDNPCSDENKRVIYYPSIEEHYNLEELVAMYKPKENEDGELITPICTDEPLSMSFQLEKQWRLVSDFRFEDAFIEKWNAHFPDKRIEEFWQLDEDLSEIVYEMLDVKEYSQIGGYGYFTQTDPRMYESLSDYTEILFQLDSYDEGDEYKVLWGDCGVGSFFATKEQLKNLDFANCLYNWDCC
ncbi:YwqG family protein [Hoylesella nanceiensis]|jgi:conserved hypothetical protein|uniref:YwqG family protein n=1 Tax=Hoylesella nanceiensis TaxID=425941 RepID=UPI002151D0B5|nr:DUF1963 domain-containing protein [Hoylesella nanceiensis]